MTRRRTWVISCTSIPTGYRSSRSRSAWRRCSTPRRPPSAARPRCCSTSTRSGSPAAGRGTRRTSAWRSTSTTVPMPRRRCSGSHWPTCSAPPAQAAAPHVRNWPTPRYRWRSPYPSCRAAAGPRSRAACSSRWAGRLRRSRSRSTRAFLSGATPGMPACACAARRAWPTRSTSCTRCCRCSMSPSTTGRDRTRSTSCCGRVRAGWPTTRTGNSSPAGTSAAEAALPASPWPGSRSLAMR